MERTRRRVIGWVRATLRRARDEERGAVLMIVALSLIVLLGMLVLVVDLGRGIAHKRQVVTGSDAAALAAAQQCALGNGSVAAAAAADDVLDRNVDLAASVVQIEMPECDAPAGAGPHTVTVTASADIEYFFAPIFGVGSGEIGAEAIAVWGPSAVSNPIPITVSLDQLAGCGVIPGQEIPQDGVECTIEYPKDVLEEPRWGVLDLDNWNDPDAAPCHVSASELQDIIAGGGWFGDLGLNGEPPGSEPTYTCLDNGLSFSVWAALAGQTFVFPVIDVPTSFGHSPDCTGTDADCRIDTANVIAWVTIHVTDVSNAGSTVVLDSTIELSTAGGVPGGAFDLGTRGIRLVG